MKQADLFDHVNFKMTLPLHKLLKKRMEKLSMGKRSQGVMGTAAMSLLLAQSDDFILGQVAWATSHFRHCQEINETVAK